MEAIKAEHVTKTLSGDIPITLVSDISLLINNGEFISITGPSGSGKSSLLYLLGLLDKPTSGKISIAGTDVSTFSEDERAKIRLKELGFIFQFHFLLPEFTALENVILPMRKLGRLSDEEMNERGITILSQLGLKDHVHKIPKKLSGGQSQRVAIARALANDPTVILADEPTGNLDTASSTEVQKILRSLVDDFNRTVIVVTHDQNFASRTDRILKLVDGKII